MRKIGFIGSYDKTDLILNIARVLVGIGKSVILIDATITQKAKYVVPVIKPTKTYITEFEGIDVAVGFDTFEEIKDYLDFKTEDDLKYDYMLVDIDDYNKVEEFELLSSFSEIEE